MLFTEARFFLFFAVAFGLHWSLRSQGARKALLLAASYAFYAGWDARFLGLILFSTCVDYLVGRRLGALGELGERRARRAWLGVSLVANLGLLGLFKYYDFFVTSAAEFLAWLGLPAGDATLGLILPVGISFYTFQTLSYTIDVYRGRLQPLRAPLDFALFVAFFPQLVAGPIVRALQFAPQLATPRRWREHVEAPACLTLFLVGFFKKACLADGIGGIIDPVFAQPALYTTGANWLASALYHVQIYADFSGYSDMAIASAGLLGYRLPLNFDFPYLARSIGDFWRRWHVSLASWMRDYVYRPLAPRGAPLVRRIGAIYVTMGLCGLWHGAAWPFVGFGVLHATYLALEALWRASPLRAGALGSVARWLGWPALSLSLLLTWPLFRGEGLANTQSMYGSMLLLEPGGASTLPGHLWLLLLGCAVMHAATRSLGLTERFAALPWWLFPLAYGFAWSMLLPWVAEDATPFIYFQF